MNWRLWLSLVFTAVILAACGGGSSSESAATPSTDPAPVETSVPPTTARAPEPTEAPATLDPESEPGSAPEPATPVVEDTFEPVIYRDDFATSIAPIFAEHCASCHQAGGPGETHWRLETAGDVAATHEWIAQVVQTQYMPPWPASDLSLPFHDDRSLRGDEIEAITQWSAAGAPLDVDATTPIVATDPGVVLDANMELGPLEPFQGSTDVADDYRCLIYDPELTESRWLTGFEFVPDQTSIVHHAIGYLVPADGMAEARRRSGEDDLAGWQCYGGSGLQNDSLFLGWAPGQLPTSYPAGSGRLAEPGDFLVMQIHYHFDTDDTPADASTIRLAWSDETGLATVNTDQFVGPAEIPCSSTETGPLCDRDAALARAYGLYGPQGVLADGINRICGVEVADFAEMTNGIASSSCRIPIRDRGQIISVFGHQHEIGKSIRMTLNSGQFDERILLDIPDWDFDWQLSYNPIESIMVGPGDTILLECTWDRSRRDPNLEPAYVLWADGTNDEMCFATMETLISPPPESEAPAATNEGEFSIPDFSELVLDLPDELAGCMSEAGVPLDRMPTRDKIDPVVTQLFQCGEPAEIGSAMSGLITDNFFGLIGDDGADCIAAGLTEPDQVRDLLIYSLSETTPAERTPIADLVSECVSLYESVIAFGFPLPETSRECIDEAGRGFIGAAAMSGTVPEEQALFSAITPCLTGG